MKSASKPNGKFRQLRENESGRCNPAVQTGARRPENGGVFNFNAFIKEPPLAPSPSLSSSLLARKSRSSRSRLTLNFPLSSKIINSRGNEFPGPPFPASVKIKSWTLTIQLVNWVKV